MADTQVLPTGTLTAPGDYVLPAAQVLTIGAVFAHFDGTGAGGSFVPTLDIISDSGHTILSVPQDTTIAAGSSAEASWAPFLKAAAAGAGAAPNLPMANAYDGSSHAITGAGTHMPVNANNFFTTDSSFFDTASQVIGGTTFIGVRFLKVGIYAAFTIATFTGLTVGDAINFSTDAEPGNSNPFLTPTEFHGTHAAEHASADLGFFNMYQVGPVLNPPPTTSFAYYVTNSTAARGSYTGGAFYVYLGTGNIFQ